MVFWGYAKERCQGLGISEAADIPQMTKNACHGGGTNSWDAFDEIGIVLEVWVSIDVILNVLFQLVDLCIDPFHVLSNVRCHIGHAADDKGFTTVLFLLANVLQ